VTSRAPRSLVLKCPTWDHVESFYTRKVKPGGALSARVPFHPAPGEIVTIALELPDQLVIALDGEVEESLPAGDGKKAAVVLRMVGLTESMLRRLEALVADGRGEREEPGAEANRRRASIVPPPALSVEESIPPPPLPIDAPVDELVEPPVMPTADQVPDRARPVFDELSRELARLRDAPAHDVLGVKWDAEADAIRRAYFAATKRLHPDALARHRSAAIQQLASEVFIHVNRAYDRMRDAAVARGAAIAAGPDLLPHSGWMAGLEDLGEGVAALGSSSAPVPVATPPQGVPIARPPSIPPPLSRAVPPPVPPRAVPPPPPVVRAVAPPEPAPVSPQVAAQAPPSGSARPPTARPAGGPGRDRQAVGGEGEVSISFERAPSAPGSARLAQPDEARRKSAPMAAALPRRPGSEAGRRSSRSGVGVAPARPAAEVIAEARELIATRECARAREILAEALRREPRNRVARALYHLAAAEALLAEGKAVDARTQLEVALAHDPTLTEARAAMDRTRTESQRKAGLLRRLFK
jgi:DnaJ domain